MALESATYISDLNSSNPAASDAISTADDHLRLIKSTIKATFPNVTGAVTKTHTEINGLAPLASPTFTGTPAAPTASAGTNTTQLATTAFVTSATSAERTASATLTNKTLTSPTITSPTISSPTVSGLYLSDSSIVFEGSTADAYETTLTVTDPTADRTITLPNATTTLVGTDTTQTLTNKSIDAAQLTGTIAAARLPAGGIIQVVQTTKTNTFSTSLNSTWGDITGMSVSITPVSTSSKILILVSLGQAHASNDTAIKLVRGSTDVFIGDTAGSRVSASIANLYNVGYSYPAFFSFVDSPSTTSATTYKLQVYCYSNGTFYLNRYDNDGDAASIFRGASSIIAMEISG